MRNYCEAFDQSEIDKLRNISSFNYERIPSRFRLGKSPKDTLVLYKGAQRGKESYGFLSHAVENQKIMEIEKTKRIIEGGDNGAIFNIIDKHTSAGSFSAFLSSTYNPEMAQVFAPVGHGGKEFTIYQLKVSASRCIIDAFNTGRVGLSGEILILGAIYPDEILAVKIINDNLRSELIYKDVDGSTLMRRIPDMKSANIKTKDLNNWQILK